MPVREVSIPSEREIGSIAIRKTVEFVKRRPVVTSLYVIGLLAAALGTGFKVTTDAIQHYQEGMARANHVTSSDLARAVNELKRADLEYYNVKGWFWQACDERCQKAKTRYMISEARVAEVTARRDEIMTNARREVGIWSTLGVQDVRNSFWSSWERGKEQAKRWTMMDAFMAMLPGGREETLISMVFKLIMQYLVNLTVALLGACIYFMYSVYTLVVAYGESFVSGMFFFGLVFCAGTSIFMTYMGMLFGVTAGGVYYVQKQAQKQRIAAGARPQQPRVRAHYD
eukprot:GEMP01028311.1.p1 GENE.GEMP01028311.1~~GEMP01028311.1.p1  ORF type:complete len:285 (+),score=41.58 GEMP01028311.1:45-899(+)